MLSEEILQDNHAENCRSDTTGECTCYLGRWSDEVAQLEADQEGLIKFIREEVFDFELGEAYEALSEEIRRKIQAS